MFFTHEMQTAVDAPIRDVLSDWEDIARLPRLLTHLRGVARDEADDLARLVIVLDGRHLEFSAQRTMCSAETLCWQSLAPEVLYVLTVRVQTDGERRSLLTVNVSYDPPGFLPDIAESLGRSKQFKRSLEEDVHRYAEWVRGRGAPAAV